MAKRSSFFLKLKKLVMCLALLFLFEAAVVPTPAAAFEVYDPFKEAAQKMTALWEKAKIALNNTEIGSIITAVSTYISTQITKFNEYFDTKTRNGQALLLGQRIEAKAETELATYVMDSHSKNVLVESQMRLMGQLAPPKHEFLCKAVLVSGLSTVSTYFDKELSRMMAEAVSNRFRCPTCNGVGGDYSALTTGRREDLGMGSPLDYPASAVDTSVTGDDGEPLADADTSGIPIATYEIPEFTRTTYTDPVTGGSLSVLGPKMTGLSRQQRFFIAKWDFIFHAAGPRPTPVSGKALATEVGKRQRAMFDHCTANQNALIKQCTDWLAYLTRPNYKDPQWDEYRKEQYTKCQAAKGSLELDEYGDCDGDFANFKGLSTYDAERLGQELCKTTQHALSMSLDGASDNPILATLDDCSDSWNAWQAQLKKRESNCLAAVTAMQSLDVCWDAVANAGRSGRTSALTPKGEAAASPASYADVVGDVLGSTLQKINATKRLQSVPAGKPVSFDEIALPHAVGQ